VAERKNVVIIGGGFGGLKAAQSLAREPVRITLIDRRNYHLFQPLLYQVATAGLAPGDIAEPIRHILAWQDNVEVLLGEATGVDVERKVVKLDGREIPYDWLIIAAGATHSYFGNDQWADFAPGLKTIGDAVAMRRRMLLAFEKAEWCEDPDERRRLMTFAIIGGGPTGVEMAGAIAEIAAVTILQDFRHIDTRQTRVILIEAVDEVLPGYPDDLRQKARKQLTDMGVEVRTGKPVTEMDEKGLVVGGERIEAANMIWAAGVKGEAIGRSLGVELDRGGRVIVTPDGSIPGHPEVMVIGDLAHFKQEDGKPLPGVAQVALQMGKHAARNIQADLAKQPRKPFVYRDVGKLATIGRRRAVADLPGFHLSGLIAWLIWVFVHLVTLVAFRNRVVVFWKWMIAYFTHERGSRLVWQDEGRMRITKQEA
jgi:NADH dehydrogenase